MATEPTVQKLPRFTEATTHGTCVYCSQPIRKEPDSPWYHAYTFETGCSSTVATPKQEGR